MENIPHEVSVSLEALMSLLSWSSDEALPVCTDASSSQSNDLAVPPTLTMSTTSSCSFTAGGVGSFEIRRASRRLDRALQTLETTMERHAQDYGDEEEGGSSSSAAAVVTVGPLIQADLVTILTSLAQALDDSQVAGRNQDVMHLYQDLALTAVRILTMHDSFPLHRDEQLDSLVDRIALLLLQQDEQEGSTRVLNALIACVNRHLIHVEGSSGSNEGHPVLFPLLQPLETLQLLKIVLMRCSQDMSRRWNAQERQECVCRLDLWSFCSFLLKHLAGNRGDNPVHEWLQDRFLEDVTVGNTRDKRHASQHLHLAKDADRFLDGCRTFGVELIEITLEILDQASIMETTAVTDYAHDVIRHASLVITTAQVLHRGLEVALPFSMLRSIFSAYAYFVAFFSHKFVPQQDGDITKSVACEILVDLANFVLQHPSSKSSRVSSSAGVCDSTMETAISITLLSAMDSFGGINDEMEPILDYMRDQGRQDSSADARLMAKRQRRNAADSNRQNDGEPISCHDNDENASNSPSQPFTNILQASIMVSLMLPNSRIDDPTVLKHSVSKLVQCSNSRTSNQQPQQQLLQDEDPWHGLVARKVKESFGIDPSARGGVEDANASWSDLILQKYVMDHHVAAPEAASREQQTQNQERKNVTNKR